MPSSHHVEFEHRQDNTIHCWMPDWHTCIACITAWTETLPFQVKQTLQKWEKMGSPLSSQFYKIYHTLGVSSGSFIFQHLPYDILTKAIKEFVYMGSIILYSRLHSWIPRSLVCWSFAVSAEVQLLLSEFETSLESSRTVCYTSFFAFPLRAKSIITDDCWF